MKAMIGRIRRWLRLLLFPPVCRFCGKRQSIFVRTLPQVLCPDCLKSWAEQTKRLCPSCAAPYFRCRCMPASLEKSGAQGLVKLTVYRPGSCSVTASLLLRAKDAPDKEVFRFLSLELMMPVFQACRELGIDVQSVLLTYAPRTRRNRIVVGHDQARELSRLLAGWLGCSFGELFFRKRRAPSQKALSSADRVKNAQASIELKRGVSVKDRTVIVLDDICTSGATLAGCTDKLYQAGAACVLTACVAQAQGGAPAKRVTKKR